MNENEYHNIIVNSEHQFELSKFSDIDVFLINRNKRYRNSINKEVYYFNANTWPYNKENFISNVHDPQKKIGICLHHTAGGLQGDIPALTGNRDDGTKFVSVPFLISKAGNIYQLMDPDTELGYHLGSNIVYDTLHNQIIGIELSNAGPIIAPDNPDAIHIEYRGETRFEKFTEAQYVALRKLIDAICKKYSKIQKKLLPENERFEFFGYKPLTGKNADKTKPFGDSTIGFHLEGEGINKPEFLRTWNGISSHVNYVGKRQSCDSNGNTLGTARWKKWDIGPGVFDWDRITAPPIAFPVQDTDQRSSPSTQWYANTEIQKEGGYFPVGQNRTIHPGIHIFSDSAKQEVRAMAPGHIVAFRYFTREEHFKASAKLAEIGLVHENETSFILLQHNIGIKNGNNYDPFSLYSLYMLLVCPELTEVDQIPWLKRLKELSMGSEIEINYATLGTIKNFKEPQSDYREHNLVPEKGLQDLNFTTSKKIQTKDGPNKVITFSKHLLEVQEGEVIGFTKPTGDKSNFFHWEVFSPQTDLFTKIKTACGISDFNFADINNETDDGIFSKDELNKLFDKNFLSSILGSVIVKDDDKNKTFKDFITNYYASAAGNYTVQFSIPENAGIKLDNKLPLLITANSNTSELQCKKEGNIIVVSASPKTEITELPLSDFFNAGITLKLCQQVSSIEITPRDPHVTLSTTVQGHLALFTDIVKKQYLLRNSHFQIKSPWTEAYWKEITDPLIKIGIITEGYDFNKNDFTEYIIFGEDSEHPVFDSIFKSKPSSENKTPFIDCTQKIAYMHPVTLLWLLSIEKEGKIKVFPTNDEEDENKFDRYGFVIEKKTENVGLGDNVKLMGIAKFARKGIASPKEITLPSGLVELSLNENGISINTINTNYWGDYTANSMGKNIPVLKKSFTVEKPIIKKPTLKSIDSFMGTVTIPFEKVLPPDIVAVILFRYKVEERVGATLTELNEGIVIGTKLVAGSSNFICKYDLNQIFKTIGILSGSEHLHLEYKIAYFNGGIQTIKNASTRADGSTLSFEDIQTGSFLIEKNKITVEFVESENGYQVIELKELLPRFKKNSTGIISEKGNDNEYRIGNGLEFTDLDNAKLFQAKDFTVDIEIGNQKILQTLTDDVHIVIRDSKLLCLIKALPDYFLDNKKLRIIFKNDRGPCHKFETEAEIFNPIESVQANYDSDKITGTIKLNTKTFPNWVTNVKIKLFWHYTNNTLTKSDPKTSWAKLIGHYDIPENFIISFDIKFEDIRGNSFFVLIQSENGGLTNDITGSSHIKVNGIPNQPYFNGLRFVTKHKDPVLTRINPLMNDRNTVLPPGSLPGGSKAWICFNKKGQIYETDDDNKAKFFRTEIINSDTDTPQCYIFASRLGGVS